MWKQRDPWHPVAQTDQGWHDTANSVSSFRCTPCWPSFLLCHKWPLMHQCSLFGISDANEWLAFFSLPLYKLLFIWWIPSGPILSPDWKYPLGPSVLSTLKVQPLPCTTQWVVCLTFSCLAGLSTVVPWSWRTATAHSNGVQLPILVFFPPLGRTISEWNHPFVCPVCQELDFCGRCRAGNKHH